jgi:hypothetical protein
MSFRQLADEKRRGVREGEMNKENQHARENPREERQATARMQVGSGSAGLL